MFEVSYNEWSRSAECAIFHKSTDTFPWQAWHDKCLPTGTVLPNQHYISYAYYFRTHVWFDVVRRSEFLACWPHFTSKTNLTDDSCRCIPRGMTHDLHDGPADGAEKARVEGAAVCAQTATAAALGTLTRWTLDACHEMRWIRKEMLYFNLPIASHSGIYDRTCDLEQAKESCSGSPTSDDFFCDSSGAVCDRAKTWPTWRPIFF